MTENTPDPTALAGYVLRRHEALLESNDRDEILDILEDFAAFAPTLANAVERVEALAEKHETTARNMGPGSNGGALAAKIAQDIRAALNGGDA